MASPDFQSSIRRGSVEPTTKTLLTPENDLVASIAHDFNGSLTTIAASAELLSEAALTDNEARLVEIIRHQARRLERLVQDLNDSSPSRTGSVSLRLALVDLGSLLGETVSEFQQVETRRSILVSLPDETVTTFVDDNKIRRMVENLLRNAAKYSQPGSDIRVRLYCKGLKRETAVIEVEDGGPGLPESVRDLIFEPYVRLTDTSINGQGLGLYIVRRFAEAHGGKTWVEDGVTGGARFCISLPLDRTANLRRLPLD